MILSPAPASALLSTSANRHLIRGRRRPGDIGADGTPDPSEQARTVPGGGAGCALELVPNPGALGKVAWYEIEALWPALRGVGEGAIQPIDPEGGLWLRMILPAGLVTWLVPSGWTVRVQPSSCSRT
jgi:hypothetical protein